MYAADRERGNEKGLWSDEEIYRSRQESGEEAPTERDNVKYFAKKGDSGDR